MTLKLRAHFITPCVLVALTTLVACKNNPQPATGDEQPIATTPADAKDKPAASLPPTTLPEQPLDEATTKKIFAALGCPQDAITATGCKVCPKGAPHWNDDNRTESSPDVSIKLEQGKFTAQETSGKQVIAQFSDCQELPAGVYEMLEMAHLVEQGDGSWKLLSAISADSITKCHQVPVTATHTRTLCEGYAGRMGEYEMFYHAFSWDGAAVSEGEVPSPQVDVLFLGREVGSCGDNLSIGHAITRESGDVNGDGLMDVTLKIKTVAGPWSQPLNECDDGDSFEGPLEPAREEAIATYELHYLAQQGGGYKEKDGKEKTPPMPAGYESQAEY